MERSLFEEEHDMFRKAFRTFLDRELVPHREEWESAGVIDREVFSKAGAAGFLAMSVPEQFGGAGVEDFRYNLIIAEEICAADVYPAGLGMTLHSDVCLPYFLDYCNEEQQARWLPGIASGELITAVAMTEPGIGSDLASMSTTALRDGDTYILNGSKTFITNGILSDLVIVACKTDPTQRHTGMSLMVVERSMVGFERGRNLEKIGMHSQDTAELFFNEVEVPVENLLGEEGRAFHYLTSNLAQERLSIAIAGVAFARSALNWTVDYVKERKAFGQSISNFQNTKFVLAEQRTAIDVAQAYVDQCILALNDDQLTAAEAAAAKFWCTELQNKVADKCLQLFGGYGYMSEYPIARTYADARITTIYGGTTEVMKTIIAKEMGL
jgi:alkylation response protein AidB-like acyl-CoA dehydrogenase